MVSNSFNCSFKKILAPAHYAEESKASEIKK
jgi:hypothetical protein